MITENLSTLKIHKLTQAQYDRELEAGNIDSNALYLTPDDSGYTDAEIDAKLDDLSNHTHSEATISSAGFMSASDKTIMNTCFTYDSDLGNLIISNSNQIAQINIGSKSIDIYVDNGLYVNDEEVAIKSNIPEYITTGAMSGTTIGSHATAEGYDTTASDIASHAEGQQTTASSYASHAEGYGTTASGDYSHAEGQQTTASSYASHAEGYGTTASGDYSHAEGYFTTASGPCSHAEGGDTTASHEQSHAEGYGTTASGPCSHAEGYGTTASGITSHAEGYGTTASGDYSHAGGYYTIANNLQYVVGKFNTDTIAPTGISDTTTSAGLFIVGIGTSDSDSGRKNGFRVNPAGKVYGTGTFGTSGADYAEYFEWLDGNPNNEDRRGHFVTLDGGKIRYATVDDDYILGVVSADPSVVGDIHSEDWHNRYLKDVFGSKIVEVVEVEETTNEDGEIIPAHIERRWVLNPDYDPDAKYVSREERPEWAAIGIVGKLVVVDDGTCQVNGYCQPNVDGIATASQEKTNYRVMERLDDTHIRIFIR